jgi:hypothetical protein
MIRKKDSVEAVLFFLRIPNLDTGLKDTGYRTLGGKKNYHLRNLS